MPPPLIPIAEKLTMLESQLRTAESNHNHSCEVLKSTRAVHLTNYPHLCHEVADLKDDENTDCQARAITQHARLENLVIVQENIAKTTAQLNFASYFLSWCDKPYFELNTVLHHS